LLTHTSGIADEAASGFYDRREAAPDVAEGWYPVLDAAGNQAGWKQNIFSYPPMGCPDSGAQVTADDLVSFAQGVRAGRLLSAERIEQFLTPQALHHRGDNWAVWYGFGLEVRHRQGRHGNELLQGRRQRRRRWNRPVLPRRPTRRGDAVQLSSRRLGPTDKTHRLIRADNPSIGESGVGFR
jgi:CubicO group peptidase (beta-lactamase class C family)